MQSAKNYIPPGGTNLSPYLVVKDGAAALDFYRTVFSAVEIERLTLPDGRVMHAELRIGDAVLMIGEHPDAAVADSQKFPSLSLYLYVPDADATVKAAAERGARVLSQPEDKFYGNREGGILDPFGITWWVATNRETLSMDELKERMRAAGRT